MTVHVKKDFDLEVPTHTRTLCGMAPEHATAGYNGEWELVHRLDTGQAVHHSNSNFKEIRGFRAFMCHSLTLHTEGF